MNRIARKISVSLSLLVFSLPVIAIEGTINSNGGQDPAGLANAFQKVGLSLFLVVMVIIAAAWLLRRYGKFNHTVNGNLKIISGLSVGQKEKIVIVQAGKSQLLLGVAPGRVQTLHVFEECVSEEKINEVAAESGSKQADSFLDRFNSELRKRISI
ncbi:MAG: flagellar biosynthetic protein FliO [Gammaproteobacteria bacterium]